MRRTLIVVAVAGLALAGAAVALAQPRGGGGWWDCPNGYGPGTGMGGPMRGGGFGMGGPMRGGGPLFMMQGFDADGDGRLNRDEVEAGLDQRLARFDADGDGALSLAEFQPMWAEFVRPRMVDRFQMLDADGDGSVTQSELAAPMSWVFARHDVDGDGAIGPEDWQAMRGRGGSGGMWNR